jgi:hypothetical protein
VIKGVIFQKLAPLERQLSLLTCLEESGSNDGFPIGTLQAEIQPKDPSMRKAPSRFTKVAIS